MGGESDKTSGTGVTDVASAGSIVSRLARDEAGACVDRGYDDNDNLSC